MTGKLDFGVLAKIKEQFGDFQIGQVSGGTNSVYLRFGYWKRVKIEKLQEIVGNVVKVFEDDDYDDDCGWLYSYKLK